MLETVLKDVRYGTRMLIKGPGFTAVALLTLMLGIGANSAIFTVVNALLLRPLPFEESENLVFLSERSRQLEGMSISYPNFTDWREQNSVFENIAVFRRQSFNLTSGSEPERLNGSQVSASLFSILRYQPALGRAFTDEEDKPGANPVVILSHGLWQRRFGSDPHLLGQTLTMSGRGFTVIGVMPQSFAFPTRVELWVSVGQESGQQSWQNRGNHPGLYGVARLRSGVGVEQARADMDTVAGRLEEQYPNTNSTNRVTVQPLLEIVVRDVRPGLVVLIAAVGFVLLIACVNVANLLLARGATREKEIALRSALGARRGRLVRQLLTESLLLSFGGGVLGLALAYWGVKGLIAISPANTPRVSEISLDMTVLGFTLGVTLLTGVAFGLAPALHASKPDLNETLKDASRGSTGGLHRHRFRSALVVVEVAVALVLLIAGGLTIRSFYRLQQVTPGFDGENLLTIQLTLPPATYPEPHQRAGFFQQLLGRLASLPGVESVGGATGLPLGNNGNQTSFSIEGQPPPPPGEIPLVEIANVSTDYFKTMRIPLLRGRIFTDQDHSETPQVIVIDQLFAERYWPGEDPLGKQIRFGGVSSQNPLLTVVGVVGRVMMEGLDNNSNRVQGYRPYLQGPWNGFSVVLRTKSEPTSLASSVRQEVLNIDGNQPIFNIRTMEQIRSESITPRRLTTILLSIFAGVALLLATVGIYGVMAYSVSQRTHEIGIRIALGAARRDVMRLVVGQGMLLASLGVGLGLGGAFLLTRWMSNLLFGVSATDPMTFGGIAALLTGVAFAACCIPARRAMSVDPMVALRYE